MTVCTYTRMQCHCQPDEGVPCDGLRILQTGFHEWRDAALKAEKESASAIQCLREIAAMGKKAGSETAQHWLLQHGYPLEDGGYVPGAQGFGDAR